MISKNEAKYIQSLYHKKTRQEEGAFVAEGVKLVEDIIASPLFIRKIYATEKWKGVVPPGVETLIIKDDELERISNLETAHEVLAIVEMPKQPTMVPMAKELVIALDGISDPGNMGTIIRLADWFGVAHIIASQECVDCYNPKVVQSTMGSIARVNIHYVDLVQLISKEKPRVFGAVLNGKSIYAMQTASAGVLLIGSEARGLRPELQQFVTDPVTIPKKGQAESLNAAMAAGIILSHLTR